jgi:aspartyl-tRNA(Asn)/glutamyl-tRNA(Gln) amidotransferase subunit A
MEVMASPIAKLLKEIADNGTDAEAVASAALSRANGSVSRNTYITLDPEWTLDQARRVAASDRSGVLHGIPVALKDCFDLEGFVTSSGSRFYARHNPPASADSWVAARLKVAGAVITGKTHLHQLAYGITGENRDYGDCLQPDDATSLTGGSSSGSAAAIQEGSALAAIGTDTGGSIRAPAALCGLAGYRASLGVGDWAGAAHLAPSFDTIGWLCRDLRDLPILARALFDITAVPQSEQVRVGVAGGRILEDCDAAILASMNRWQDRLRQAGAQVEDFQPDFWREAYDIYAPIQAHEAAKLHAGFYSEFEPAIAERLRWGASIPAAEIAVFRTRHEAFVRRTAELFSRFDFLLMPATPAPKLPAGADHSSTRPSILRYTTPASLAGLPAVVLPAHPAGMQLLAARSNDAKLLQFANRLGELLAAEDAS